jgi:hypothetical protein
MQAAGSPDPGHLGIIDVVDPKPEAVDPELRGKALAAHACTDQRPYVLRHAVVSRPCVYLP